MPPHKKFSKSDIINTSLKIIENEGENALNARKLATVLGCSVQPIFHNFTSMEELNKVIYNNIYKLYSDNMLNAAKRENLAYKEIGLAYIEFAKEHSEFFKMIFMKETNMNADTFMASGGPIKDIIEAGMILTKLSYEEQKLFHKKVWIFTHGIACLVATKTIKISEKEIEELLSTTVLEMLEGFKKNQNKYLKWLNNSLNIVSWTQENVRNA